MIRKKMDTYAGTCITQEEEWMIGGWLYQLKYDITQYDHSWSRIFVILNISRFRKETLLSISVLRSFFNISILWQEKLHHHCLADFLKLILSPISFELVFKSDSILCSSVLLVAISICKSKVVYVFIIQLLLIIRVSLDVPTVPANHL